MANLPDEIWRLILESGVKTWGLSYRDVCRISISSRRLRRLANEDSLWSMLLAVDFPAVEFPFPNYGSASSSSSSSNSHPSPKFIYKTRFEREKEFKLAAHRRAVLRLESQIAVCSKDLGELRRMLIRENERMKATELELKNLEKVRQASVSLNVWQPATVRSWQKQIVEQSSIPVEHHIDALEMELKVCKKQAQILNNSYNEQKRKLKVGEEELASLKYHPTRDHQPAMFLGNYRSATSLGDRRGKKLKRHNNFDTKSHKKSIDHLAFSENG